MIVGFHRSGVGRRFALAMLLVPAVCPAMLYAQFQAPTDEEMKATADPKAPGADAVYLYREELDEGSKRTQSFYERLKVLNEKGKELATVKVPYVKGEYKVVDVEARTIHSDGTIVPMTAAPSDLVDVKGKHFQVDTVFFTLPSVEVGSILEYRYKLKYEEATLPAWDVQQPYFIHKAHYLFNPVYPTLMYAGHMDPKFSVVRNKSNLTLDVTDIPPIPDEDWMPPLNTLKWRVDFFNTVYGSEAQYWTSTSKFWGEYIDDFTKPTDFLKKTVAEIISPGDSEEQKARKIYVAVMKLNNTEFTRSKSKAERKKEKIKDIKKAEDVWKQQGGTPGAIALLYAALGRSAGLKASPVLVVNRNRAVFEKNYMSLEQFDEFIDVVEINGKEVYLDPGEKMCPYGSLHWKHTLTTGLRLTNKDAVIVNTPGVDFRSAAVTRTADLDIDDQGNVTGTVRMVMTGPEALHWRQAAIESDEEEVKKDFNESMAAYLPEGVHAEFDHFLALDEYESALMGIVKVSGNLGAATGKRIFLPGLFFASKSKHPFVALEKRKMMVDVHYPSKVEDEVNYHLPTGYQVESAPETANQVWTNYAILSIKSVPTGNSLSSPW